MELKAVSLLHGPRSMPNNLPCANPRIRRAIWRGYNSIQEAGGWATLVFAGPELYRFCKYGLGCAPRDLGTLKRLRTRFEVAADTIHPKWRQLLSVIGEPTSCTHTGHPCDWVVSRDDAPVLLAETYSQWTEDFHFEHLEESVRDEQAWGSIDPRTANQAALNGFPRHFFCEKCGLAQSNDSGANECNCFATLYGSVPRRSCPVQVFRTGNGRNNGLIACCVSVPSPSKPKVKY